MYSSRYIIYLYNKVQPSLSSGSLSSDIPCLYILPAFSPRITALLNPACSISLRPRMVNPPGVVTLSIADSGCSPEACSSSTAPFIICSTIFCATFALKPISTAPSTFALTYLRHNQCRKTLLWLPGRGFHPLAKSRPGR